MRNELTEEEKYEINLNNWEFVGNLTKEEKHRLNLAKNSRGWYRCKKCNELKHIDNYNFKHSLSKCVNGCHDKKKELNEKQKINLANWEWVRNLSRSEMRARNFSSGSLGEYICRICKNKKYIRNSSITRSIVTCENGCHGMISNTATTVKGVNDVATTHPHLIKYFCDIEDGYRYRANSNKSVLLKCPNCGHKKKMCLTSLTRRGMNCQKCSSGISYPERLFKELLNFLNVEYIPQFKFDNFNRFYDFYLPNYDVLIELHGIQHYRESNWGRTYEEEHESDLLKYDIAVYHGYEYNKNYFVINCSYSALTHLQEEITKSSLCTILDFGDVDWIKIGERSEDTIVKSVCDFYNKYNPSIHQMSEAYKVSKPTIRSYLKRGTMLGLCNYDQEKAKEEHIQNLSKEVVYIDFDTKQIISVYNSTVECGQDIGYAPTNIGMLCKGKHNVTSKKLNGRKAFYYVDSSDWERDKHMFKNH